MESKNAARQDAQLDRKMGFWDLMSTSTGQIIGSGILSILPICVLITGRSVPIAFAIATIIILADAIPSLLLSSVVRLKGGTHSQVALLGGAKFAGLNVVCSVMIATSISVYAISIADYILGVLAIDPAAKMWIALGVMTFFWILNMVGVDIFAKAQNVMVILLVLAFLLFCVKGIPAINWPVYFVKDAGWMPGGVKGLLHAGALLTFATSGCTLLVNFSPMAKRPTRDIPAAIILSTVLVCVLYSVMGFVAAGVLPLEELNGSDLVQVAKAILTAPEMTFFMVAGVIMAIASTLSSSMAALSGPYMQMAKDGWLPKGLLDMNKFNIPWKIQTALWLLGVFCIVTNISLEALANICLIAQSVVFGLIAIFTIRIPKLFPEAWAKSKYHVSDTWLKILCGLAVAANVFNLILNMSMLDTTMIIINVVLLIAGYIFGTVWSKRVTMNLSYEVVNDEA